MINLELQGRMYWNYKYYHSDTQMGKFQLSFDDEKVKIWSVEIEEKYRGNGYGQDMVTEIIVEAVRLANQRQLKKLWLYVFEINSLAIHIYKKLGFKIVRGNGITFEMELEINNMQVTVTSEPVMVCWCNKCQTYTTQTALQNGNVMCWCGTENDKSQSLIQTVEQ